MGATIDREELAWAAGFFDGEGYIAARNGKGVKAYRLLMRMNITQKDRRVLDRFAAAVGLGRVYGPYRGDRHMLQFSCEGFERVQAIVGMIWAWLSPVKREQARRALHAAVASYRTSPGPARLRACCINGHALSGANMRAYTTQLGYAGRGCRACERDKQRFLRVKRKTALALLSA